MSTETYLALGVCAVLAGLMVTINTSHPGALQSKFNSLEEKKDLEKSRQLVWTTAFWITLFAGWMTVQWYVEVLDQRMREPRVSAPSLIERTYMVSYNYGSAVSGENTSAISGFGNGTVVVCGRKLEWSDLELVRQDRTEGLKKSLPAGTPPRTVIILGAIEIGERPVADCSAKKK